MIDLDYYKRIVGYEGVTFEMKIALRDLITDIEREQVVKANPLDCEVSLQKCWQKEKPDYACIFVTKHNDTFNSWQFAWEQGEHDEKDLKEGEEETRFYYLAWLTNDGDGWDDIFECDFDEYLVLQKLPTMEEVHQEWIKSFDVAG